MKQLYLIRHAKSSWDDAGLADFERPLSKRGQKDAPLMGRRLAQASVRPDLLIASSARRARKTAGLIADEIGYHRQDIELLDEIYSAGLQGMVELIRRTSNEHRSLGLVGHNHVITECAEWLSGASVGSMPTCGIVAMEFDGDDWRGIDRDGGRLLFFDYPKRDVGRG